MVKKLKMLIINYSKIALTKLDDFSLSLRVFLEKSPSCAQWDLKDDHNYM